MAWSGYIADLVVVAGFELGGCLVAEAAVQPGAVVPGDVLGDGAAGGGAGGPGVVVEQLAFDRAEEAVGQSVVPALTGPAVGQPDLVVVGEPGELGGCVLARFPSKQRALLIGMGLSRPRPLRPSSTSSSRTCPGRARTRPCDLDRGWLARGGDGRYGRAADP